MAAATGLSTPARRRLPRYQLSVPVEVTVLRSGIPETLPGRALDLGLGGLALVLAGDLYVGESIGIELHLPGTAESFQAKARVRHQDRIRSGIAFVAPTPARVELIRTWARESSPTAVSESDSRPVPRPAEPRFLTSREAPKAEAPKHTFRFLRQHAFLIGVLLLATGLAVFVAVRSFFSSPRRPAVAESLPQRVIVPSDSMSSRITYRAVPTYPESARLAGIEGIVILDAVIGKDGRVLELRPLKGPGELVDAASEAVRLWRFSPFTLNGDAVEVETTIEVGFRLSDR